MFQILIVVSNPLCPSPSDSLISSSYSMPVFSANSFGLFQQNLRKWQTWECANKLVGWKTNQQSNWMKNKSHSHAYCDICTLKWSNKPDGWKTNLFLNVYSRHDNWEWENKPMDEKQTNWCVWPFPIIMQCIGAFI